MHPGDPPSSRLLRRPPQAGRRPRCRRRLVPRTVGESSDGVTPPPVILTPSVDRSGALPRAVEASPSSETAVPCPSRRADANTSGRPPHQRRSSLLAPARSASPRSKPAAAMGDTHMPRFSLQPLGVTLPRANDDDLQTAFRASASSIVELLRAGQRARQRAYQAGMSAALEDVLHFLQSGLDQAPPSSGLENLLNYIDARQAALRSAESDDSEDEPSGPGPSRPRSAPLPSEAPRRRTASPRRSPAPDPDPDPEPSGEPAALTPGPRTRSQTAGHPSSPIMPASSFTFECQPPRTAHHQYRRTPKSARAVVLEAAASVVGMKRALQAVDEAVDVSMDEEPAARPTKRFTRRPPAT